MEHWSTDKRRLESKADQLLRNRSAEELAAEIEVLQDKLDVLNNQTDTETEIEVKKKFNADPEEAEFIKAINITSLEDGIAVIRKELRRRELLN